MTQVKLVLPLSHPGPRRTLDVINALKKDYKLFMSFLKLTYVESL